MTFEDTLGLSFGVLLLAAGFLPVRHALKPDPERSPLWIWMPASHFIRPGLPWLRFFSGMTSATAIWIYGVGMLLRHLDGAWLQVRPGARWTLAYPIAGTCFLVLHWFLNYVEVLWLRRFKRDASDFGLSPRSGNPAS